jgi:HD superfamily phosphohydrolase
MPKWGLTAAMCDAEPWGLPADLVGAGKVVADPIHGDVYLTRLEVLITDSVPMQRLRRVRQLGTTCYVYPAATHSRFSHAIGTVRAVQDLLDAVWDQPTRPKPALGLLDEWSKAGTLEHHFGRATVLARLGGLLHDLCHLPFGHSLEDDLKLLPPHDENQSRFDLLWSQMPDAVQRSISGDLYDELAPLVISKTPESKRFVSQYPWVQDIVGNTICADLLDYLPRDHLYTGLPIALGHRFLEAFYVTPTGGGTKQQRMALMLHRDGHERIDVATELLKYLRYRYELSERALVHHAKLAADAMVGRLLEAYVDHIVEDLTGAAWSNAGSPPMAVPEGATRTDEAAAWRDSDPSRDEEIRTSAQDAVESRMLAHGDDGLIEYLVDLSARELGSHTATMRELACRLQSRSFHKQVGRCTPRDVTPRDLYAAFGERASRRELERQAAEWAGITDDWQLIIWLPPAGMRLKPADVLVSDGSSVRRFVDYERPSGQRGNEIYLAHENLWSVAVYVAPEMKNDPKVEQALVWLAHRMDVRWEQLARGYSATPATWPEELLRRELAKNFDAPDIDELFASPPALRQGTKDTFAARMRTYTAALKHSKRRA